VGLKQRREGVITDGIRAIEDERGTCVKPVEMNEDTSTLSRAIHRGRSRGVRHRHALERRKPISAELKFQSWAALHPTAFHLPRPCVRYRHV